MFPGCNGSGRYRGRSDDESGGYRQKETAARTEPKAAENKVVQDKGMAHNDHKSWSAQLGEGIQLEKQA